MADEEVGARLRLKDRPQFQRDADAASRSVRDIGDSADKADRSGRNMAGGMGLAKKGVGGLMSVAKMGAVAVGALGLGVGALAVKTVGLAMDAGETASKFNTVFAGMEEQVGSFVKTVNTDYGIPTKDLQDAASTFGVFGKAAGVPSEKLADFSTSLTQAGLDLGSFYNQDPTEVFAALQSGLAGQTEPLRQFGIFMSDASLNAYALEQGLGKTTKEMSDQEKVALRQSFILANLGDANGDLARTSDSLANKTKALKGRLTEAGTAIGTSMLPYASWLAEVLDDKLTPAVSWLQAELPGLVNSSASAIGDAYQRVSAAWAGGASYGEAVAALTGFDGVVGPVNDVADALGDVWVIVRDGIIPAFGTVSSNLPSAIQPLKVLDATLDFLADNAALLHPLIVGMVGAWVLWNAAVIAHNAVMAISGAVMAARVGATMLLTGATGLATGAELTRNQALLASIALHARLGAMMVWNAAKAVGSMVLAVGATVGGWILMGITAMASGVTMAAAWIIGLGPIGWAIGLLILIGAAFVVLWKKSETFRDIVTGAMNAVKGAAIAVKNEVVASFNNMVSFFSGLPSRISSATSGMWNGIKNSFKSAVNWVIDKWNNLSFGVPAISVMGKEVFGGASVNTPNIPRLHQGGTTTSGGAAIIKPQEEMVVLPPAASVVPLDTAASIVAAAGRGSNGSGGSSPTVLQVVLDRKVLAEAVYDHTGDKVARR